MSYKTQTYQFQRKKYIIIDETLKPFQAFNDLGQAIQSIHDYDSPMAIVKSFKLGTMPKQFVYVYVPPGKPLNNPLAKFVKGKKVNTILKESKMKDLKILREMIRQELKNTINGFTYNQAKSKAKSLPRSYKYIYGTRSGKWHIINRSDRDYDTKYALTRDQFLTLDKQQAQEISKGTR